MIDRRHATIAALLAGSALTAFVPTAALAQSESADASAEETAADDIVGDQNVIIVTGTNRARVALDTPLAVTTADSEDLRRLTASSQADILNSIPTIKADGGGGEVATNVFVKGLPSGGQYQFTPLMYDAIPVFTSFGLNSSAFDVYYRNDLGIERLEFVRGGVSNLFGPGSVAGLINYISKTGTDRLEGTAQLEVGEIDRYRGDLAVSGPLGSNFYFAASGYYRDDAGPLRTDLKTKGYQIRGNLKLEEPDGTGSVTLYGQYIDDEVQFFLPVPLDGTTRSRIAGNDGKDVFSVNFREGLEGLAFQTPDGLFTSDIADGVATKGGTVALVLDKDFPGEWGINFKVKYSDYKHKFGLFLDGDGRVNVPETLQGFLTNRGLGSLANAQFTYVGGGVVPAGDLLFANRFIDRDRPAKDLSAEFNLTKTARTGAIDHQFTLGAYYGFADARDINVITTYLAEFANTPRLVNLVVNGITYSRNGLLNAGAGYTNNHHKLERYAGYFADQMETGRFIFDIGARIEKAQGYINRERSATFITDTSPNISNDLRDVIWGSGVFQIARVSTSEWALAAGALYKLTDDLNVYANASRGYFFPEIRAVGINALNQPASYDAEIIKQAEVGLKYGGRRIVATLAGIYTKLDNRRQVLFVNNGMGGVREQVNLVATESYGLEGTLSFRLIDSLSFNGNATLQHHEYTAFDTAPTNIGNELERQPNLLYNAGLYYDDAIFDAALFTNYTGDNFTASNNAIVLNGFNIVNFDAGVRLPIGGGKARLGVNVFNLFDTDATTEGSPRQDASQSGGGAFFVGRPVLPRRIIGRLTFNF